MEVKVGEGFITNTYIEHNGKKFAEWNGHLFWRAGEQLRLMKDGTPYTVGKALRKL